DVARVLVLHDGALAGDHGPFEARPRRRVAGRPCRPALGSRQQLPQTRLGPRLCPLTGPWRVPPADLAAFGVVGESHGPILIATVPIDLESLSAVGIVRNRSTARNRSDPLPPATDVPGQARLRQAL